MKLILYNDELQVLQTYENITQAQTYDNNVVWNDGSVKGIKHNFIILEDEVEVLDKLTPEIIALDKKRDLKKRTLEEENAELKDRLVNAENAILTLMDRM